MGCILTHLLSLFGPGCSTIVGIPSVTVAENGCTPFSPSIAAGEVLSDDRNLA